MLSGLMKSNGGARQGVLLAQLPKARFKGITGGWWCFEGGSV